MERGLSFNICQEERNEIWRKTHENQQLLKKFISQFHDTITFLQVIPFIHFYLIIKSFKKK